MRMKLNIISICFYLTLIIVMAKAQSLFKLRKPVVDLNARPLLTTTPKLPEERRKLSIFPKNMAKFVVTSKPYAKVRTYSPWEISTKKPLMQKMLPSEVKTSKMVPVTKPTLMKYKYQQPVEQIPKDIEEIDEVDATYLHRKDNEQTVETPNENYIPNTNKQRPTMSNANHQFVSKDTELDSVSTDKVSVSINDAKVINTESSAASEMLELEGSRQKRLSVQSLGEYNNIEVPSKYDRLSAEERKDSNEFIFMNDKSKRVDNKQPPNSIGVEEDMEFATEVTWLEEYSDTRPKRSVNIIEEENLGTTIAGFKFTGRVPHVNSNLVYKNINA